MWLSVDLGSIALWTEVGEISELDTHKVYGRPPVSVIPVRREGVCQVKEPKALGPELLLMEASGRCTQNWI